MRVRSPLLLACVTLCLAASAGTAQPPPDGGGGGFPGRRGGGGGGGRFGDPNQFFNQLSGGKDVIRRADIQDPRMQGMFDRMAARMNITNGEITREQFTASMQNFPGRGGPGGGPPGNPGGAAAPGAGAPPTGSDNRDRTSDWAEAMFRRLDQNGDGVLNHDEMPEALQAERDKWDTDRNGLIDLNEFKAYFQARMQQNMIDRGAGGGYGGPGDWGDPGQAPAAPPEEEKRPVPVVHRAGKLPKEVPAWFQQLDTDQDAQVGLYEWRAAGRPLDEFLKMDRNGDGFLTVDEVLHYLKQNGQLASVSTPGAGPGSGPGGPTGPWNGGPPSASITPGGGGDSARPADAGRNRGPGGGGRPNGGGRGGFRNRGSVGGGRPSGGPSDPGD